jgi:hypothetical protein
VWHLTINRRNTRAARVCPRTRSVRDRLSSDPNLASRSGPGGLLRRRALAINDGSGAADGFTTICYGANDTTRPTGDAAVKLPCALCAVAAAGGGLLPDPIPAAVAPLMGGSVVRLADAVAVFVTSQVRDGLARAPPNFA